MKNIIFFLVFFSCDISIYAQQRSEAEMRSVAMIQLSEISNKPTRSAQSLSKVLECDELCVYADDGRGFVIVSKDIAFNEVLGYSTSTFDANHLPCGLKWWIDETDRSLTTRLNTGKFTAVTTHYEIIAPMLTTKWGQEEPYNLLCPDVSGVKPPCGCVATAMSQIMYYYRYPEKSSGTSYYTIGASEGRIPINLSTSYAWGEMKDKYIQTGIDAPGCRAVAQLMADAGAGSHMNYNADGSGTNELAAAAAFATNFGYDPYALRLDFRSHFSDDEWMSNVYSTLMSGQPILYCGADPDQGGHAFIFDGIDSDGNVHVNWGWDGESDGYYSVSNLCPSGIFGPGTSHFTTQHSMMYGFKCQSNPDPDEHFHSIIATTSSLSAKSIMPKSLTISMTALVNYYFYSFDGEVNIVVKSCEDPELVYRKSIFDTTESGALAPGSGLYVSDVFWRIGDLKAGEYVVYLESMDKRDNTPSYVRTPGGKNLFPISVSATGAVTIGDAISTSVSSMTIPAQSQNQSFWLLNGQQVQNPEDRHGILIIREGKHTRKVFRP